MGKNNVVQVAFQDNRNSELFEKITELIRAYASGSKMTVASVVGVLEMVKFDLIYDNFDDSEE